MNVKGIMDGNGNGNGNGGGSTKWAVKEDYVGDDICDLISIGSMSEDSINSSSSSSSALADEEATSSLSIASSSSSSSSSHSNGPLYQLSELMDHLPIKRGLSMFYKGKAQSFTSLARVQSIEDLPKKLGITPYRKKIKTCKNYGTGLDGHRISYSYTSTPKATISKKAASRGSFVSVLSKSRPSVAVHTRSNF